MWCLIILNIFVLPKMREGKIRGEIPIGSERYRNQVYSAEIKD
jgi:hypothetical protein